MNTALAVPLTLECIDGKDDHYKVDFGDGEKLLLGQNNEGEGKKIEELEGNGYVAFTNTNGALHLDASNCSVPVKINGRPVKTGVVKEIDVLMIGHSIWKTFLPTGPSAKVIEKKSFTKSISNFIGTEDLQDFKLGGIFSEIFKKHTFAETEEQLFTGTSKNVPNITEVETSWAKPWLFSRLIVLCIVITLVLVLAFNAFENYKLIPNIIVVGTFVMPLATLIFFMELNALKNISIYYLLTLLFLSGVISLIVTLLLSSPLSFIYQLFDFAGPAAAAPIIEEPAKILVVAMVMAAVKKYKWILNGLLIGAAVGAGFGALESAGYAFEAFVRPVVQAGRDGLTPGYNNLVDSIVLRGFLAPFMHVIWTANAAGALWLAKGDQPFSWNLLTSPIFLRVFLLSVALHFIWNSDFGMVRIPVFYDVKFLILGIIAWVVAFMLIQTGLKQLNVARHAELERLRAS